MVVSDWWIYSYRVIDIKITDRLIATKLISISNFWLLIDDTLICALSFSVLSSKNTHAWIANTNSWIESNRTIAWNQSMTINYRSNAYFLEISLNTATTYSSVKQCKHQNVIESRLYVSIMKRYFKESP